MKESNENLSAQESLDLITKMIRQAQGSVKQNSFYFLLWGWVVVLGNLGMYALIQLDYPYPYAVWVITIPAWLVSMIKGFRQGRNGKTATHLDHISAALWVTFGICIFTIVFFGSHINYHLNAIILIVSTIPTVVSGLIIRFRPLIFGGIFFWIFGILCFVFPGPTQFLLGAGAVIVGYLIPGYMLRKNREA